MSNIDMVRSLLIAMSGQDNQIHVNRIFVDYMESLEGGIFLQQLIFWSDKSKAVDGYFYKTYLEWKKEVALSEYSIRKFSKVLREKGVLETKLKRVNGSPILHYKLDITGFLKNAETFLKNSRMDTENFKNGNCENEVPTYTDEYNRRIQQMTTTTEQSSSSEIFNFYESEFGPLSNFISEEIGYMIEETNEELTLEALKLSVRANKRTIKYAAAITRNWRNENIQSLDDLRATQKMKGRAKHGENQHQVTKQYDDGVNF